MDDDQRKQIVDELNGLLMSMVRGSATSPSELSQNEQTRTVISRVLSMLETDDEKVRREQGSPSSKGGV